MRKGLKLKSNIKKIAANKFTLKVLSSEMDQAESRLIR